MIVFVIYGISYNIFSNSLNRISPSKLSLCNTKENNGISSLEKIPAGSDSSCSHKDDVRSISSEEFLAMERSTELDETLLRPEQKEVAITNNGNSET